MLKAALTFLAIAAGSAVAVGTGNTIYSAFQFQLFPGSGMKVMQDPANVWSWHREIPAQGGTSFTNVLVDFDSNNRMDTEYPELRVLVTDMQVRVRYQDVQRVWLVSGGVRRWLMYDAGLFGEWQRNYHLATPLVLAVGADLRVEVEGLNNGSAAEVNLIGRVVTL